MSKVVDAKSLTVRQKYLLDRIPTAYNLNGFKTPDEPKEVKDARKLIERYDKDLAKQRCFHKKETEALVRKATEAIYFHTDEEALQIIRQIEKLLKTCEE